MSSNSERVSWCVVYSCLAVVTIAGNCLSIPVFLSNTRLRRMRTSLLLINLAVADLLVGAIAVPMYMVYLWPESSLAQNATFKTVYLSIDLITGFASLFSLAAIALERVYSVLWPHRHRATRKTPYLVTILICWLLAALQMLLRSLQARQIIAFKAFFYNMMFALSVVLIVMCIAYTAVWHKVRAPKFEQSDRRISTSRMPAEQERKLVQTLAILTGVFLVTWLPFHALNITMFFCVPCQKKVGLDIILAIKLLHFSNSFMNLIIYSFRFPDFRRTLAQFFGRHLRVAPMEPQMIGHQSSLDTQSRGAIRVEDAHISSL